MTFGKVSKRWPPSSPPRSRPPLMLVGLGTEQQEDEEARWRRRVEFRGVPRTRDVYLVQIGILGKTAATVVIVLLSFFFLCSFPEERDEVVSVQT